MIANADCNAVFLADLFPVQFPDIYRRLVFQFDRYGIHHGLIPGCKDIWVTDFMPLQTKDDYFVHYKYDPDYLQAKKWQKTISNTKAICEAIELRATPLTIKLDGGNVVSCGNKAIVTTKIFKENEGWHEYALKQEIKAQLKVEQLIVIPQEPNDPIGHADSMVRFLDENTVLVNHYPNTAPYRDFGLALRWSLHNAGLHCRTFPYYAWKNKDAYDATGCYLNYLEVGPYIFMPWFNIFEDMEADISYQDVFGGRQIIGIVCPELAKKGGVLNCATWRVKLTDDDIFTRPKALLLK
ncbi:MAG: agmatine deiminase family protein [Bacteroidetes bacterium]|uniref:agmatine deiminase family protein n=1 Tax=Phnomibacter sp. TaxID=2836217 RepID=UPI002FDE0C28|nr:agmatine deiminase family protein [Bacteroidota bacterium]